MSLSEQIQLRTSENCEQASLQTSSLLVVRWFTKTARFVSSHSYTSWTFIQLTTAVLYLLLNIHLFLVELGGNAQVAAATERVGRVVNSMTAVLLAFWLGRAYFSTHNKRILMIDGNWSAMCEYSLKTLFRRSTSRVVVVVSLVVLLAGSLSVSLFVQHWMSVSCHLCKTTLSGKHSIHLAIISLVVVSLFSATLFLSTLIALLDILLLNFTNTIFAQKLFNELGGFKKTFHSTTCERLLELNSVYKPMLDSGTKLTLTISRSFFVVLPCMLVHTLLSLFPPEFKTSSASLSQLCFPVGCALTLIYVTTLLCNFNDWKQEYHERLTQLLEKEPALLEQAKTVFNYPLQFTLFSKGVRFNFCFTVAMILCLLSLFVGAGLTVFHMISNYRLELTLH